MLQRHQPLAIYMEGSLTQDAGKMGFGVLRYSPNPVACVIDSDFAGLEVSAVIETTRKCPIVASLDEAASLGAEVLVLGIAPSGGLIPRKWFRVIDEAVRRGMSIVNGLHDRLAPRYPKLREGQFVWDIRVEPEGLGTNEGRARDLSSKRILMIGSDMACGKMTAGLELCRAACAEGIRTEFVATGQIGIAITGAGVPLDAVRVDYAAGAIEREVLRYREADWIVVEGQGALAHPASSATLPLLRGAMPTHLVLCHRAGAETLRRVPWVAIPPLRPYAEMYEDLACAMGSFPRPRTAGICLNTSLLQEPDAREAIRLTERDTGLPTTDPVRFGAGPIVESIGRAQ